MKAVFVAVVLILAVAAPASAQHDPYAGADSADAADDALVGVDAGDVSDVTEALDRERDDAGTRTTSNRFARVEAVSGYRRSVRAVAGAHGAAAGVYHAGEGMSPALWVDVRSGGWLERVTAGGLRLESGAGLVLGARRSRFGSARRVSPGGLRAGPSLSRTSARRGGAVSFRIRALHVAASGWKDDDGAAGRWVSVESVAGGSTAAVGGGVLESGDRAVTAEVTGSTHGVCVNVAAARAGGVSRALARTAMGTDGAWSVEVYGGEGRDADGNTPERGGAIARNDTWGRWHSALAFYTVAARDDNGVRLRRRLDWRARAGAPSGERVELSMRIDGDERLEAPSSGRLVERVEGEHTRRSRLRARLDLPAGASLTLVYRGEVRLEPDVRPGVVAGLDARYRTRRVSVRVSLTNVALERGAGTVTRPGIAGYEVVSTATRGSDASARASVGLGAGWTASLYIGAPWERPPRALVSLRWTR